MTLPRSLVLVVPPAAMLLIAGHALGQTALGDGRGLERNPQIGFGGYNVRAPDIHDQIRMNNAIITGNAPGGRSFRGYVGYAAPSDFRGSVASDTLYSFRRDSAISGAFGSGVRGTDALRYQFALSTGQALPPSIAQGVASVTRSGAATTSSSAAALRSTSDFIASQTVRPMIVGGRIDEQGYEWTVKASPLTGVNWARSTSPVVRVPRAEDPQAKFDLGAVRSQDDQPELADSRRIPGTMGLESTVPGVEGVLDREVVNPLRVPSTRVKPVPTEAHADVLNRFRTGVDPATGEIKGAGGKPDAGKVGENAPEPAQSDSSLDAQLERLRRSLRGDTLETGRPRTPPPQQPAAPDRAKGEPEAPKPVAPGLSPLNEFDPRKAVVPGERRTPTRPGEREADEKRTPMEDRPSAFDDTGRASVSPLTPEMIKGMRSVGGVKLESLVRPRVAMPGDRRADVTAYETHMSGGQAALIAARYFDAEDRFTRALASMPGDPMAQVGRAHAQLGAGLYLSAAANLRTLFAEHPEMIGATYGSNLVPNNDRTERILEQLRAEMAKDIPALGKDAALLMAYLGHIRTDRDLTTTGLTAMAKCFDITDRAESTLLEACRAAWAK